MPDKNQSVTLTRGIANPSISVLLPVYNGAKYLEEAVRSILGQTFQDFELLALDDGSSDESLSILRAFERRDRRVRVSSRENRGIVTTLNELIAMAKGEFLARMDADDICFPDRFAKQVAFLHDHAEILAVGTAAIQINATGLKIGRIECPQDHESIQALLLKGHCPIFHPAVMVRTEAMVQLEGYRSAFPQAQDLDLWLRMSEVGKLANLPDHLLLYRLHSGSISESAGLAQREAAVRATGEAWARRGISGQFHPEELWRPGASATSKHRFALQYGWTAWAHGYRNTWQAYAWEALRIAPLSWATWKLVVLGLLRRPSTEQNVG